MNYFKIVTVINWVVVGVLGLLVLAETVFPAKGGDAASLSMGRAIYYMALIILAILLILNLLPFKWSKYTAFAMAAIPFLYLQLGPSVRNAGRVITGIIRYEPAFEDNERENMSNAILDGKLEKLKKYIEKSRGRFQDPEYGYPLLETAVKAAVFPRADQAPQLLCIRLLLDAGVPIQSKDPKVEKIHYEAAFQGSATVLRMLLENGAGANAKVNDFGSGRPNAVPIIFEALSTPYGARDCVQALLQHGADPNGIKPRDGDRVNMSILLFAAERQQWGICRMLLDKGADPHYTTPDGLSLQTFLDQGENFYPEDEQALADFEAVSTRYGKQ